MTFNLFGTPTKDDIRVGYIDPTLGYVDDVTICEANDYAKNNPGTVFIFKDGNNNLQYLNINEVNKLDPNSLLSTTTDECGGIQEYVECGPPRIQISGGGGVGAVGNPVIGKDGSLLAVDVVSGGFGYKYPPIAAARDDCQIGNGAVLTAVLGETADQTEVYDGEEDFEEYEICDPNEAGYGTRYDVDGNELDQWDPSAYSTQNEDPIKKEIEAFQKALESPFWSTRKTQPDRITVLGIEYATQTTTNVTYSEWGEFMNTYAVSPVKPSDTTGTDESGKIFTMEWEYNFPITGEYIFRGVCDDVGQVYIDGTLVGDLQPFKNNPSPLQKTIIEGNHIIRIDLLNTPVTTTSTTTNSSNLKAKFVQEGSSFYLQVDGTGSGEISFVMDVNDSSSIAGLAAKEVRIPADDGKVKFVRETNEFANVNPKNQTIGQPVTQGTNTFALTEETIKKSGTFTGGRKYGPIEIIGAGAGARGPIINSPNRLGIRDADGDDENIKITIDKVKGSSTTIQVGKVISPKSWNANPMGVSLIIDAPTPPVPQEKLPPAVGECPPNPIWTTRFPGASQTWYPVNNKIWTEFFNRYAISPVLPLDTPGSDGSGIFYKNSWQIEIPYRGYYAFQAQRDNTAKIYVDGNLAFDVTTSGDAKWVQSGLVNRVKTQKVLLEKGLRTISIELENTPQNINSTIDQKIFSTQDWRTGGPPPSSTNLKAKFVQEGSSFYLQVDGTGSGDISFIMDVNDASFIAGLAAKEVRIPADGGKVKFVRTGTTGAFGEGGIFEGNTIGVPTEETIKSSGTFTGGRKYGPIEIIGAGTGARGPIINSPNRLGIRDADGDDENIKITIDKIKASSSTASPTSQSSAKDGVTYSGPSVSGTQYKDWSIFMNNYSLSPGSSGGVLTWKDVNFPEDGMYKFNFQADNVASLKIGGVDIITVKDFKGEPVQYTFNLTKGKYEISISLQNTPSPKPGSENPCATALYISKDIIFSDSNKASWVQNPIGISAILVPPPCSKKIGGKGVVDKIIVDEPGNGYLPVETPGTGYPVTLILDEIIVEDPGINYSCGEDEIRIVPDNGAKVSYKCGSFGQITEVTVENPGYGFDIYPEISMPSKTGVNVKFKPVFKVVRDPILPPGQAEKIIQVTDLVGLKQTGYVDGRAYYGAIYYDEGIPYAGYYKTAGTQVRVYATLQESITAKVTTPPSAIQRSGTDIRSNDPRLNIPGTIQSTTDQ